MNLVSYLEWLYRQDLLKIHHGQLPILGLRFIGKPRVSRSAAADRFATQPRSVTRFYVARPNGLFPGPRLCPKDQSQKWEI